MSNEASEQRWAAGLLAAAVLLAAPVASAQNTALLYAEDSGPASLNPLFATKMVDTRMAELMFDGLFTYDKLLNPLPALAKSWKVSKKGTKMMITLANRTWHDGEPLRPEDIVFTIDAMKAPSTAATDQATVSFIERAEAREGNKVELFFARPVVEPERRLMFKVLPKHAFPKGPPKRGRRDPFRVKPVGTGSYRFEAWEETTIKLLHKHGDKSGIPQLHARFIPKKEAQLQFLQYDALHAIVRILPKHRPVIEGMAEKVTLLPYESLSWWYLGVNHRHPVLRNVRVRQAIASALDRDELRRAHLGEGQTISGPFAPSTSFYNDDVKPYPHNPKLVAKLMKRGGYKKKGKWFVDKRGRRVKFRLAVNKEWSGYQDVVIDMQDRLKRSGFDVKLEWYDPATWKKKVILQRDFDLTLGAWSFDESSNVFELFHTDGSKNYFGFSEKRMDTLLAQSVDTFDPELFRSIYLKVHEKAHTELPYIFLWSVYGYTAISNRVSGVEIHPFRYFTWIDDWRWER